MPSPLKSLFSCFKPSTSAEDHEPAPALHTRGPQAGAPTSRHAPTALQNLPQRRADSVRTIEIAISPHARARFDAQRVNERRAELDALLPATRHGLSDGERQLGGYLLGRDIVGKPVQGAALAQIERANDTVEHTRQTLAYGRGNINVDIRDSQGESTVRAEAGRRISRAIPQRYSGEVRFVAGPMTAQAGNCGDHASVATFLHADKLQQGEQVFHVGSKQTDHGWAEQRGKKPNRERDLVMDPWGKGPAVFAVDGEFSQSSSHVALQHHYDHATGAAAHAEMRQLQSEQGRAMQAGLRSAMNDLGPQYRYPDKKIWAPTPVISQAFAHRVQQKIIQPPDAAKLAQPRATGTRRANEPIQTDELRMVPLRLQVRATKTARTLGATGIREVTDAAERISEVAANLRDYRLSSHPAQTAPGMTDEFGAAQSAQRGRRAPR